MIPVAVLVMVHDLLSNLQYLQYVLLQESSPRILFIVPCCVLGMFPVDWDPRVTSVLLALVEACWVGRIPALTSVLVFVWSPAVVQEGLVVRARQHRRGILCCPWQLFARPLCRECPSGFLVSYTCR